MDIIKKLLSKTDKSSGCWVYLGQPSARYAEIKTNSKRMGIHRWSYMHYIGEIKDGYEVDHKCRNTKCWNPDHLQALPRSENARANKVAEANLAKTHCVKGHEFTKENTYLYGGHRRCKICRSEDSRKRWISKKLGTQNVHMRNPS